MNILITGGAGFIGTHLTKQMVQEGHSVRILDNLLPQVHGDNAKLNFTDCEFVRGDVCDSEAVTRAIKDINIVYHLAAETGVGQSQYEIERYISTNTLGTAVVLQAAVAANVKQVIITSSRAVYGEGVHVCTNCGQNFVPKSRQPENLAANNWEVFCPDCGCLAEAQLMSEDAPTMPTSVYGLTKLQQEQIAAQVGQTYNLPISNLRLFNIFGPGQSLSNPYVGVLGTFFRRIKSGQEIEIYEDGQMKRDFVYVGDVVKVLSLAADNPKAFNQTINVGTGEVVTLEKAGEEVFNALGAEPNMVFSGKYRSGDIHHAVADTQLIQTTLEYVPQTKFADGLREFVAWALMQDYDELNIDSTAERQLMERNLLKQAHNE